MIKIKDNVIEYIEDDKIIIEMFYMADEFVWVLYSKNIIVNNDCELYEEICKIMNNNYIFQDNIPCFKKKDMLVWLSDQYCDIDDIESVSRVNRLIIKRFNDSFLISVSNPFFEKNNINKSSYLVSFSPLFNGFYSRNIESGLTLQDDFCIMYQNLFDKKRCVLR